MANIKETLTECQKKEFILSINDYNTVTTIENGLALATLIQRLIILQPGSYPNHPNMGVGISNYEFEILDDETINEIQGNIESQIATYIPDNQIQSISVEAIENELTGKTDQIGVMINLSNTGKIKDISDNNIILTFDQQKKKGKIVSKIYI